MHSYFKNHTLAAGALLLTLTGIASRILGFFYRIFLSRTIGAEGLGVYQMVFPIYGICFSICAGSIQTAISRFTAADRTGLEGLSLPDLSSPFHWPWDWLPSSSASPASWRPRC
ncbi:MAG: oligosaccharide flippase family protein [Enterocloster sp.]